MKFIYLILIIALSLEADEIQRIESIVNDIAKLRVKYEQCQNNLEVKNKEYEKKILSLENKIKILEKQLKSKEKYIKKEKYKTKIQTKTKYKTVKTLVTTQCQEQNPFPKLIMKDGVKKEIPTLTEASAFRLNKDAKIYNAVDGSVLDTWEKSTSFTSNQRTQSWIKITGYFNDKVWHKSKLELWIRASDALQR